MNIAKYLSVVMVALLLIAIPAHAVVVSENGGNTVTGGNDGDNGSNFLEITQVKIDGDVAEDGDDLFVERGQDLDIRVTVEAGNEDADGVQIEAFISGYRYSKYERDLVSDYSDTFNLPANNKRSFDLNLEIPQDMQTEDAKLRIVVTDQNSDEVIIYNYQLSIYGADKSDAVAITDFFITPSTTIEAGRALSFKVKVKNYGEDDLDDIKVIVSIPELDLYAFETLDTLDADETQSFEALLIRIPADAEPGSYEVKAEVDFDRYESTSESQTIKVIEGSGSTSGTSGIGDSIVTMPESVDVIKGSSSVYPILIQNQGKTSATYVLSTSGISTWGSSAFEPSSVVIVKPGQSETVYLRVTANADAEAGDRVFQVTVKSGDQTEQASVLAAVKESSTKANGSLTSVLEWVLIILIVVLIVLGLVIAFRKFKKNEAEKADEEQTYY